MIGSLRDKLQSLLLKYRTDQQYSELVRTSFLALAVRMIGVGTGFLVTLITGRYYGASSLGIVSICIAILSFASVFGRLGIDIALLKNLSSAFAKGDRSSIKANYLATLKIIVPASLLISFLLFFFAPLMADRVFHKPYLAEILRMNAWLTLPLVLVIIHAEAVRSIKKITAYTFFQTVGISSVATVLLVIFYFISPTLYVPVKIQFFSIVLIAVISLLTWMRMSGFFLVKVNEQVSVKELMRTSSAMFTTTLMQLLMSWAGTLILAAYSTEGDVGVYNAISRISIFTNISILAVNSLVQQRFAAHHALQDPEKLRKESAQATRLIFLSTLPVFLVLFLFPHFILSVFGRDFPGHENELYILLAAQFIVAFVGLPSQLLNMTGRHRAMRNISIISAMVNLGFCFLLTPIYGLLGTCLAQLAGTFVWNFLSILIVKKELGFYTFFSGK